jgi:uncharacterized membrane protein
MNERLIQALIRFAVSGVLAAIAFFIANATVLNGILVQAGTDPVYAGIVTSVFVALLNSVSKYLGGATQAATRVVGRGLAEGADRPNPFAI